MRKRKNLVLFVGTCLVLILAVLPFMAACAKPAPAEPITLKMLSFLPPNFGTPKSVIEPLQAGVLERSNGELIIDWVGGPEAVPMFEQPAAVVSGVVDMLFTVGTFYKDRVPENATLGLSKITPTEARETGYYDALVEAHAKANMRYLGQSSYMSGFYLFLVDEVKTPSDLAGLKFPTDPTRDPIFKALGIIGVEMEDAEVYSALERGVIGGLMDPVSPNWLGNVYEVENYLIDHPFFNSNAINTMNLDSWNRLPKHLQKALMDAQIATEKSVRAKLIEQNKEFYQNILDSGVKPITFSAADAEWFLKTIYAASWADVEQMLGSETANRLKELTGN